MIVLNWFHRISEQTSTDNQLKLQTRLFASLIVFGFIWSSQFEFQGQQTRLETVLPKSSWQNRSTGLNLNHEIWPLHCLPHWPCKNFIHTDSSWAFECWWWNTLPCLQQICVWSLHCWTHHDVCWFRLHSCTLSLQVCLHWWRETCVDSNVHNILWKHQQGLCHHPHCSSQHQQWSH